MKNFYLVDSQEQLFNYQQFVSKYEAKWHDYIHFLRKEYQVRDLPQALIWANEEAARKLLGQSPVPAYTNDIRMVMTPDLAVWKKIYQHQLDSYENSPDLQTLSAHYKGLSENHLLQIIGHELAHWSDLFLDDFADYDANIWFEEGMVEYISRQYFLTEEEQKKSLLKSGSVISSWLTSFKKNTAGIPWMILENSLTKEITRVFFTSTGEVFSPLTS